MLNWLKLLELPFLVTAKHLSLKLVIILVQTTDKINRVFIVLHLSTLNTEIRDPFLILHCKLYLWIIVLVCTKGLDEVLIVKFLYGPHVSPYWYLSHWLDVTWDLCQWFAMLSISYQRPYNSVSWDSASRWVKSATNLFGFVNFIF